MVALFLAAFMMGLLGSPHCLGMCGGIVSAFSLSMQQASASKKALMVLLYHLGRLLSYMLLGLLVGFIGAQVFQHVMSNQAPRYVMGFALVLIGAAMLGLPWLNWLERLGLSLWQRMQPLRKRVLPMNSAPKALGAGLLWGFLPCGLVYGALLLAVSANSPVNAAVIMLGFGLGTMPMLLMTAGATEVLQGKIKRFKLRSINGVILILSGLAIALIPAMMKQMHGNHHGSHGHESHSHGVHGHAGMSHGDMAHDDMAHEQMQHDEIKHHD